MRYAITVLGKHGQPLTQNQVTTVSHTPFMQAQGCSGYCGLCAPNNAMQRPALTVQGLDNVADDLWLEQLQNMNLEFISDLQQMRSLDGFYSIDVLCKGAEDCGYTLEQLLAAF